MDWFLVALQKYSVFTGRSRRKEYWMFTLFNLLGFAALSAIAVIVFGADSGFSNFLSAIYWLALTLPTLAVSVRRLHDIGHSGWWFLFVFIPIIGQIALLVWMCRDGTRGDNQYGSDPKPVGG